MRRNSFCSVFITMFLGYDLSIFYTSTVFRYRLRKTLLRYILFLLTSLLQVKSVTTRNLMKVFVSKRHLAFTNKYMNNLIHPRIGCFMVLRRKIYSRLAIVLLSGHCLVSFQSFSLRHLVHGSTKKLPIAGLVRPKILIKKLNISLALLSQDKFPHAYFVQ